MSQSQESIDEDPKHDIYDWDSGICDYLLPSWQDAFMLKSSSPELSPYSPPFLTISTVTTELIFSTCSKLDVPLGVFFLSVDLFDNFIANHLIDLFKTITEADSCEERFSQSWTVVKERVATQLYLRMLNCIQLASKIVFRDQFITTAQIKKLLDNANQKYSIESIIVSEFRVLRTLKFKIPLYGALDMLEQLLKTCTRHIGINSEGLHPVCVDFLKLCYLQHHTIRRELSTIVENNHITSLLASGSFLASVYTVRPPDDAMDIVLKDVASRVNITLEDLLTFLHFILKLTFD